MVLLYLGPLKFYDNFLGGYHCILLRESAHRKNNPLLKFFTKLTEEGWPFHFPSIAPRGL